MLCNTDIEAEGAGRERKYSGATPCQRKRDGDIRCLARLWTERNYRMRSELRVCISSAALRSGCERWPDDERV